MEKQIQIKHQTNSEENIVCASNCDLLIGNRCWFKWDAGCIPTKECPGAGSYSLVLGDKVQPGKVKGKDAK